MSGFYKCLWKINIFSLTKLFNNNSVAVHIIISIAHQFIYLNTTNWQAFQWLVIIYMFVMSPFVVGEKSPNGPFCEFEARGPVAQTK